MNEPAADAPRRGRPPNSPEVKKGHPTWKPANVDETYNKEAGFRYRWLNEDQTNLSKKELENWEIVSDTAGSTTNSITGYGRINDGKPLTTVRKRVGQILGRIPEEIAESRDAFFDKKSSRSMTALRKNTAHDLGKVGRDGAPLHGEITIEKKGVRNIIKE